MFPAWFTGFPVVHSFPRPAYHLFTLPAELRARYSIKPGDTLHLVDLDRVFILTPVAPLVPELTQEIERLRQEVGLSTEDLLAALGEQREAHYWEHHEQEERAA